MDKKVQMCVEMLRQLVSNVQGAPYPGSDIKGELYSREFNQHFRADKTICSLKEDKDGNFNLNIDGVSLVSWFRR